MHHVTLHGTPAEMGAQHGALMLNQPLQLPEPTAQMLELAKGCEAAVLRHTPALVEEMHAFAEAAQLPYDAFMSLTLTAPLQQNMPSCSVVAVMPERSANGKLLIGRNYDFAYDISWEGATTYTTTPASGHAHIGSCDIWIGREDGLNAVGLFAAMSATFIPGVQPGLPFWFIVRHILETCTTVDEAADWIQTVPHSQSRNYMLADGQKAVVAEASIHGVCLREPEDGVLVMTNHPAHPELKPQAVFVPDDSHMRFDRLRALAAQQVGIRYEDMAQALNDRTSRVCAHMQHEHHGYGTIWSVIAYPEDRQLAIAPGTGDDHSTMVYQEYTL
ncbi:MAG: hypothetical protein OHK0046_08630 [Anaerolineae bacterium]